MRVAAFWRRWATHHLGHRNVSSGKLFVKMLHTRRKVRTKAFTLPYFANCLPVVVLVALCQIVWSAEAVAIPASSSSSSSEISGGIIQGFLGLNSSTQEVSSSTLASLINSAVPTAAPSPSPEGSPVPNNPGKTSRRGGSSVEESRRQLKQYIPDYLFAQRNSPQGQRRIRDRARFLVGSLSRQNCFSKVICGLGARPPSTKTDLLNDYVYLMNELLTEDEEKSGETNKVGAKTATKPPAKKKKPGGGLFTRDESPEEDDLLRSSPTGSAADEDDYNPILAQIADEELVADDPAILKFMELEMKKREKMRPRYPYPPPHLVGRYPRVEDNATEEQRQERESRYLRPTERRVNQFVSKRRLELQNEKDFRKRLSLAADAGRTLGLGNRRQCRLLFDDCPLDEKQIDSLVIGLRRIIDSNGNFTALVASSISSTTPSPATAATSKPGSKVEIILHLNQNGMPYNPGGGVAAYQPAVAAAAPSQIPPPPPATYPTYAYPPPPPPPPPVITTTTTQKPVGEEQLLDFLYGVVNFNGTTTEDPAADEENFDWLVPQRHAPPTNKVPSLDDYLETPLKAPAQTKKKKIPADPFGLGLDTLFDEEDKDADPPEEEEIHALRDYLSSLKETLLGLYQMNNASLAVAAGDLLADITKSSEESKEGSSLSKDESEEDFFEIAGGKKRKKKKGSKDKLKEILSEEEEEDSKSKEVLLKVKVPGEKKKKKKKQPSKAEASPEEVDDEKLFDEDQEDNKAPPKAPPKKKATAGAKKKKKKPVIDDEDVVKEVPQEELEGEEEEEDEDEEEEDDEGRSDESGEGEYEVPGEEDEEDDDDEDDDDEEEEEDEEEGRGTGGSKRPVPRPPPTQRPVGVARPKPTKITLIFAPSGSGPDASLPPETSDLSSAETQKLKTLTQVLLPTAPAPPPLSPKKPIVDKDDRAVVPAARPVTTEFEKVASFVENTRIVNISEFDENSPQHPSFHKKWKKRPSYRHPVSKKQKATTTTLRPAPPPPAGYQRPSLGRPVEEPQDDNDRGPSSLEVGSSEEEDEDEEEDDLKDNKDKGKGKGKKKRKRKPGTHIEFGHGHVPLPGPGPPGVGRLPPKGRDDVASGSGSSGDSQEHTKTLIAVPYFRQEMETRFAEGPPPGELATGSVSLGAGGSSILGNIFSMMGMKQGGGEGGYPHHFGPAHVPHHARPLYHPHHNHRPYISFEVEGRTPTVDSGEEPARNESQPLLIHATSEGVEEVEGEVAPPKEFKSALNVDVNDDVPQDDKKGKKKGKKKNKKKKKKKKKGTSGSALISQVHWQSANPSLFIEGDGIDPVIKQLKNYVSKLTGTVTSQVTGQVLYIPPEARETHPYGAPFHGWGDSSEEVKKKKKKKKKGKGSGKGKECGNKKGGRRESRRRRKKKKKGQQDDQCAEDLEGRSDLEETPTDQKTRDDLKKLEELIGGGPLIIDPSQPGPTVESITDSSTTSTTLSPEVVPREEAAGEDGKSTIAPKVTRYRVTKRPRTPKTTERSSDEILFASSTTQRSTTEAVEMTSERAEVARPTKRRLQYKRPPNNPTKNRPLSGLVFTSTKTQNGTKEDDEEDRKLLRRSSEVEEEEEEGEEDDDYSAERQGRLPFLDGLRRRPYKHSLRVQQQRLGAQLPPVLGQTEMEETPTQTRRKNTKKGGSRPKPGTSPAPTTKAAKGAKRKKNGGSSQPPQHPPLPTGPPPTTGWAALKNLNIRNFLSRYGNSLLDKTMAAYNNG